MNNFEKIKQMSVEELAEFFTTQIKCNVCKFNTEANKCTQYKCPEGIQAWLNTEAKRVYPKLRQIIPNEIVHPCTVNNLGEFIKLRANDIYDILQSMDCKAWEDTCEEACDYVNHLLGFIWDADKEEFKDLNRVVTSNLFDVEKTMSCGDYVLYYLDLITDTVSVLECDYNTSVLQDIDNCVNDIVKALDKGLVIPDYKAEVETCYCCGEDCDPCELHTTVTGNKICEHCLQGCQARGEHITVID